MAIDKRHTEIKEGAGLDESRLNVEFVDFLRKWSTPVLLILAIAAVGYFLYTRQQEARRERTADAFRQFTVVAMSSNPSPESLVGIAEAFGDVRGIGAMARLAAADEYLRAVRRNLRPGSELGPGGVVLDPEDELKPEERARFLDEAERLYRRAHADTVGNPAMTLHTLGALYGLAAVAECVGDLEAARNVLDQALMLAEKRGYPQHVVIARERITALANGAAPIRLYRASDLAPLPELPAPRPPTLDELMESGEAGPPAPEAADQPAGAEGEPEGRVSEQADGPDDDGR
ncbi:MAG: hypothetical protein DYG93_12820 [Leptolyngbya sp. PLA2]|nr:hypothetical protein [Leptolyngbya sp.]MCE7972528.1 hypothetical protein [Leptolyngbya sp. PL-A2]MCZ7632564.1 hypothetical protein [Phycisphaerales bacterium]MDL1904978.1 hypothetical protein [Synechococcales cyanobacterium CNB]GIK19878.1 MAG: hypothetical protein BroJett004_20420 [Planctomycetota bacterium]